MFSSSLQIPWQQQKTQEMLKSIYIEILKKDEEEEEKYTEKNP